MQQNVENMSKDTYFDLPNKRTVRSYFFFKKNPSCASLFGTVRLLIFRKNRPWLLLPLLTSCALISYCAFINFWKIPALCVYFILCVYSVDQSIHFYIDLVSGTFYLWFQNLHFHNYWKALKKEWTYTNLLNSPGLGQWNCKIRNHSLRLSNSKLKLILMKQSILCWRLLAAKEKHNDLVKKRFSICQLFSAT